ncbi:hypothetical protein JR316_0000124 [Psilocybe cubensis]|uniref:Uncharacterized protein n=2 Tax=Psilocybe cubensis TaxID=181762 RepID=A0ACB8HEA8_PSICU|nr:hypothetical protein JR316_0000124 [Psilocybe cubensis]KAH9486060.1 hypothetical protein JR316_0000124 [Psilocybe cubensis]
MSDASIPQVYQDVETGGVTQVSDTEPQDVTRAPVNVSTKEGRGWILTLIRVLRLHSFVISLFTLFLLLSIRYILYHAPLQNHWGFGGPKRATTVLAAWMFAAVLLTFLAAAITVFKRKMSIWPHVVAILIDIVLASGIIASAVLFTHEYPSPSWCNSWLPNGQNKPPHHECWNWKDLTWLLMKMAFTLSIILSVILAALIVCHIIAICEGRRMSGVQLAYARSKSAFSHLGSFVPYTVKINISFERKPDVQVVSEAPLGQGPVHI